MADPTDRSGVDGILASLEASFDASIDREEQEAASDLAFSLAQGRDLADVLARSGPRGVRLPGGRTAPIAIVGRDYVASVDPVTLVPLDRVIAVAMSGKGPVAGGDTLVERLRALARQGEEVEVGTEVGSFSGRLALVGPDHLQIERRGGNTVVALAAVAFVRALRGEGL